MKHKFVLLMLPLLAVLFTACPSDPVDTTGSISGIIRDALNSNPLQGAIVTLSPSGQNTTTGSDGRYQFSNVERGDYEVNVARADYRPDSKLTTVQMGQNSVVDFTLGRANSSLEVTPTTLDFGASNTHLNLNIKNVGQATMTWEIFEDTPWLSCSTTKGTVLAGQTGSVAVTIDKTGLAQGSYENTLVVTSNDGGSVTIQVKMAVDLDKLVPTVSMIGVNSTDISATLTGSLISIGSSAVTDFGFYWTTNVNMSIDEVITELGKSGNKNKLSLGRAETAREHFDYNLYGLSANSIYYVYAYAINSVGPAVSDKISFTTLSTQGPPTVVTGAASQVTSNSAVVSGVVTDLGCVEGVTQYGHVWSNKTSEPTVDHNKTEKGELKQTDSYTSTLTNLEPNTLYYVRAYATNKFKVIKYGEVVQVKTLPADIKFAKPVLASLSHNEATFELRITDTGNNTITERGVCWGTNVNPTLANNYSPSAVSIENYTVHITGLTESTNYHVRAYAKASTGITYYSEDLSFSTTKEILLPSVSITTISNIKPYSVKASASVVSNGGGKISDAGFCYSTSPNPTITDNKKSYGKATSSFSTTISNLQDNTLYYVRAYVTNERGTSYGDQVEFRTLEVTVPTVSAVSVSDITFKAATFAASVTSLGNGTLTKVGFCYSTSHNPTINNTTVNLGTVTSLKTTVTKFTAETTYYVRAFAENEKGIVYSEETSFTTTDGGNIKLDGWDEDKNWN